MSSRLMLSALFFLAWTSWASCWAAEPAAPAADSKPDEAPVVRQPKTRKPPAIKVQPILVAVMSERGGRKTLAIDYRWSVYDKASVEVRLVPATRAAKGAIVVPVFFVGEQFRGKVVDQVYRCLDKSADLGTTDSFTKDKMVYQIVGGRNSLGRASVHVLPYNEGGTPAERPGAVFLQLDSWAVNDHFLSLDLPRDVFRQPGTLFVWFLRGEKLLWEQRVDWPGY
ncbi:MAG: hypothetical protein ABSF26_25730 [Thermoguttaceae bacterium]|jgi:hypothetical protein